jgi:anti-anti-sigma regulatory factor
MSEHPALEIAHFVEGDRHTLQLVGTLDRTSVPIFERAVRSLLLQGASAVSLDLGNLTGFEPIAVRAVFQARALCTGNGCQFSVVPLSRLVGARSPRRRTPNRSVATASRGVRRRG